MGFRENLTVHVIPARSGKKEDKTGMYKHKGCWSSFQIFLYRQKTFKQQGSCNQ
jgi:hypothetical protein